LRHQHYPYAITVKAKTKQGPCAISILCYREKW